jgi:glycosyltransferase involved in cell wall biosynthesis
MKNVLFIVYYFPPMGGSGVQRPLKFVKYLRNFGWNPIVLRPETGIYKVFDESLQKELEQILPEQHLVKGNTPFHLFGGKERTAQAVPTFVSNLIRKILKLLMYPDNKKGWIKPGLKQGLKRIEENDIDLVFRTAPPFSNHILGAKLKEETNIPLILDYRDSWMQNQFFTELFGWQKRIMNKMERECVQNADAIIGLDEVTLNGISKQHNINSEKLEIVEHGFDPQDFESETEATLSYKEGAFNLLYSGTFVEHNKPDTFIEGIAKGIREGKFGRQDIHLHFQGGLSSEIRNLIKKSGLENNVSDYGYVNHKKAIANLKKADALWVLENYDPSLHQVKNGKLFEYFGSEKPILGVVNTGISATLLEQYGPGFVADVTSPSDISEKLTEMIFYWETNNVTEPDQMFIQNFNRKKLTQKLAQIFDKVSSQ